MLQNSIEQVLAIDDYRPSAVVNELFSRLVEGVVQAPDQMSFTDETMRNVQRVASAAETELELYWSRKIQCAADPRAVLGQFPYTDNYAELGYGLDIGIRFPLRVEVANSFEGFKYKATVFRVGTTMNISWGRN